MSSVYFESKSREDALHEAVLMVLDEVSSISTLDHVPRWKHCSEYLLCDRKAQRNLFKMKVDQLGKINFIEYATNNVHREYSVFHTFVCQPLPLYSREEKQQIETLSQIIYKFCIERMNNEALFIKRPQQPPAGDEYDYFDN